MATLLRVPEVAAGATEVVLSEWLVAEGDRVERGAAVVVVETEKAVVEIEAEGEGVLIRRLGEESATIEVGTAYALVGSDEEAAGDVDALLVGLGSGGVPTPAEPAEPEPDDTPESREPEAPAPEQEQAPASSAPAPTPPPDRPARAAGERVFVSPIARRILAEAGIDPAGLTGSGPQGRVVKADAEAARDAAARSDAAPAERPGERSAQPPTPPAGAHFREVEHSRLRRLVATRLTESKATVPHFYVTRTVRLDALLALRAQLNEVATQRISVNDLIVRGVAVTHRDLPEANVTWTDEAMRHYETVDVGVAIAAERGLVTPVLRDVEQASVGEIGRRVRAYVDQAGSGRLQQRDLEGGSISVTNLGMHGVEEFAAIINPPQSAILAVGAATPTPAVTDGEVRVATTARLVLSVDHRAIDGALAARWMAALVANLEAPLRLLA